MPSLRRTFSSPSVRSSPYPTSLGIGNVRGGHGPRRSSGSDVSQRRVLADIDWWRVADGQREPEPEHELNENEETDASADPSTTQDSPRSPADAISDALADFAAPAPIAAELALQQSPTSGPSEVLPESRSAESVPHVCVLDFLTLSDFTHLALFCFRPALSPLLRPSWSWTTDANET